MLNHCNLLSDTFTIQNGYKHYDFKKCLTFIENKGKQDFGQNFKIKEEDLETIFKLLIYMIKDENNALKLQLNLSRGIFVWTNWMRKNILNAINYPICKLIFRLQNQNV